MDDSSAIRSRVNFEMLRVYDEHETGLTARNLSLIYCDQMANMISDLRSIDGNYILVLRHFELPEPLLGEATVRCGRAGCL